MAKRRRVREKPVAVTHVTVLNTIEIVARFDTVAEAEACITGLRWHDPVAVRNGLFGIDAPEEMVNG